MARLSKQDHPTILRMVDVEHRKVAEVAAEYGCSAPTIYTLLGKLRRSVVRDGTGIIAVQPPLDLDRPSGKRSKSALPSTPVASVAEARHAASEPVPILPSEDDPAIVAEPMVAEIAITARSVSESPPARPNSPARGAGGAQGAGVGGKLAKPGFGLMMRTADGDENLTPFRSLDDLLSAIKPILRASARSPDPVWFSLQPVDLASIDTDTM